jgi:protein-tyrosine phosphatase
MFSIKSEFGTYRGLVRTVLDTCLWYGGKYRQFGSVDWDRVRRIVFVCQGNICRSPFAEAVARNMFQNLPIGSAGLSTTSGAPAFALAQEAARRFTIDLSEHRTTAIQDFPLRDGDLIVAMEARHIAPLRRLCAGYEIQIALLGLWCRPRLALLYDPHCLSNEYFITCFDRIHRAVVRLADEAGDIDAGRRSDAHDGSTTEVVAVST